MIKRLCVLVILAAALRMTGLLPFETRDVAQLKPVEAVVISVDQGEIVLRGEECTGRGISWEAAWEDLKRGAAGDLFLGTAEQIILVGEASELLSQVAWSERLRPAAMVCACVGEAPDPEEAARYLSAHNSGLTLQKVRAMLLRQEPVRLPLLVNTEGGLRLYGTHDR
jgi:hypothetical protein